MIPKVIHYCWFGRNPKPDVVIHCIESWRKHCPGYEIKEWNEDNFDIGQHPFMKAAYDARKWAFVSDVARLIIIHEHGGIYLDTDVELYKSLDLQLQYDYFCAFESLIYIASGLGFGASKKHPYVKAMLDSYNGAVFNPDHLVACPKLNTDALMKACPNLERNGNKTQIIDNGVFYSASEYYSFANHLGAMSWVEGIDYNSKKKRKRGRLGLIVQRWLKTPEKCNFVEKHFGEKALRIYVFFAYDFFDCGVKYLLKRKLSHIKK